jgi:small subunit ribosomal protein S24e
MKLKVTTQNYNPLLKRKEVAFEVEHAPKEGTPSRAEMRKNLAENLKANVDLIFIKRAVTKKGSMLTVGEANIYDTQEQVKIVEADHIITRNIPPPAAKPKEEAEAPKQESVPPAAKPKEEAEAPKQESVPPAAKPKEEAEDKSKEA